MPAHDSFVIRSSSLLVEVVLVLVSLVISRLVKTFGVVTSLIEVVVTASSIVEVVIAPSVLVNTSESSSASASISSATSARSLVAIIPLHGFQSQLHHLRVNWIIRLSQFGVAMGEVALLPENAIFVSLKMSAPFSFVFLVDFILSTCADLLLVAEILRLVLSIPRLSHLHLVHLMLLHHLHLIHHLRIHLHLHMLTGHLHSHLIGCVHLQLFYLIMIILYN
jgi:hypothetical protein